MQLLVRVVTGKTLTLSCRAVHYSARLGSSVTSENQYKTLFEECTKSREVDKALATIAFSASEREAAASQREAAASQREAATLRDALAMSQREAAASQREAATLRDALAMSAAASQREAATLRDALAMSQREAETLREHCSVLSGLLLSRRVLEDIATFKHPDLSYAQAVRKLAKDPGFVRYLRIVGAATGFTANALSASLCTAYSELSSCVHGSVLVVRTTTVIPAAVFRAHDTVVSVCAATLYFGHHVGASGLTFTTLDSKILTIPAPAGCTPVAVVPLPPPQAPLV